MYLLFGGVIKSWMNRIVVAGEGLFRWSSPITHKKKRKVSHRERRARAKARVKTKKFCRRALTCALIIRCRRRPSNKPPPLVSTVTTMSEPVRWKWKKKPIVGLKSVMSSLQPGTLASFCEGHNDFLRLPKLMGTLCNHDYHVKQIKVKFSNDPNTNSECSNLLN